MLQVISDFQEMKDLIARLHVSIDEGGEETKGETNGDFMER